MTPTANDGIALDRRPRDGIARRLLLLSALFALAGIGHFVRTDSFQRIVPDWVPAPRLAVYWSGVAELAGAIGLLLPLTRVWAGWGLIALLIAVFPANVHMLNLAREQGASGLYIAALWARLPFQPLLIWWIWQAAIRDGNNGRAA